MFTAVASRLPSRGVPSESKGAVHCPAEERVTDSAQKSKESPTRLKRGKEDLSIQVVDGQSVYFVQCLVVRKEGFLHGANVQRGACTHVLHDVVFLHVHRGRDSVALASQHVDGPLVSDARDDGSRTTMLSIEFVCRTG